MPSPNYSSRGGSRVRLIVVHTAEGALTIESLGSFFASSSSGVSSHTGADDTPNTVGEYVKRGNKAWTQANANPYSVAIELCAFASWSSADWARHPAMLENCGRWIAEEARAFGIPLKRLSAAEAQGGAAGVCGHNELGASGGGHWDPGPDFPWADVLAIAQGGAPAPAPADELRDVLAIRAAADHDLDERGRPMPPEYLLHADNAKAKIDAYFGCYPSGLVRQLGDEEREHLKKTGELPPTALVKNENACKRLRDMDLAIQGELGKR
jgi:hypothetical protein